MAAPPALPVPRLAGPAALAWARGRDQAGAMDTMVARRQPVMNRLLLRLLHSPLAGAVDGALLGLTVRGAAAAGPSPCRCSMRPATTRSGCGPGVRSPRPGGAT